MIANLASTATNRIRHHANQVFSSPRPVLELLPGEVQVFDPDKAPSKPQSKATLAGQLVIAADWEQCRMVLDLVARGAESRGFDERSTNAIRIALEEALANAVNHGSRNAEDFIRVEYKFRGDGFRVRVTDQGPGFDSESVPDPTYRDNIQRPSGRGLLLMRHYMTVVRHNERGNRVEMFKLRGDDSEAWGNI